MHWFGGSIAEAIALSKQRNAIFVVFIEGDNEQSTQMATTLDDSAVVKKLSNTNEFLVIKIISGSVNYTHFAQIYQFVPVPSLFFINRNGTPLEVVCAGVDAQNLVSRIERMLELHKTNKPNTVQPSTSRSNVVEQTVNLLQSENAAKANDMGTTKEPVKEPPAEVDPEKNKPNTVQPSTSSKNVVEQTVYLLQAENAAKAKDIGKTKEPVKEPPAEVDPETSSGPAAKIPKTEFHEVTRSGQEYEVVCDGDVCIRKLKEKPEEPGPSTKASVSSPAAPAADPPAATETVAPTPVAISAGNPEEKVQQAKELINAIRKEKSEKEKETEKQKELERRAVGQSLVELKRWQAEQEMKQIQEDRKREKIENNLARQRILEQIAQDRAERRARDQPPAAPQPPQTSQPSQQPPIVGDGESRARVQFKMADGSAHTGHFDADTTLLELRRYVVDNMQLQLSEFTLWTAFPRQELTENNSTLRQMRLVPSAALLVLPRRVPAAVASPSTFSTIFTFLTQLFATIILEPAQQVYAWLRARLFPSAPPAASPASSPAAGSSSAPVQPALRRRGNIHRLAGDRNSDDDNNTWNGNSTQQM